MPEQINEEMWAKAGHLLLSNKSTRRKAFDYIKSRLLKGDISKFFLLEKLLNGGLLALDFAVTPDLCQEAFDFFIKNFQLLCNVAIKDTNFGRRIMLRLIKDHLPERASSLSQSDLLVMYAFLVRNLLVEELKDYKYFPESDIKSEITSRISELAEKCIWIWGSLSIIYVVKPDIGDREKYLDVFGFNPLESSLLIKKGWRNILNEYEEERTMVVLNFFIGKIKESLKEEHPKAKPWMVLTDHFRRALDFNLVIETFDVFLGRCKSIAHDTLKYLALIHDIPKKEKQLLEEIYSESLKIDSSGFVGRKLTVAARESIFYLVRKSKDFYSVFPVFQGPKTIRINERL